jgi:hypothetical protein
MPTKDGEPLWIAQKPIETLQGITYTTIRANPLEWAAPLNEAKKPIRTGGMIRYEKVKQ